LIKVWSEIDQAGLPIWKVVQSRRTRRPRKDVGGPTYLRTSLDGSWLAHVQPKESRLNLHSLSSLSSLEAGPTLDHHCAIDTFEWHRSGSTNLLFVYPRNQTLWIWAELERAAFTCLAIVDARVFHLPSTDDRPIAIISLPKDVMPDLQVTSIDLLLVISQKTIGLVSLVGLGRQDGSIELPLRSQRIGSVQPLSGHLARPTSIELILYDESQVTVQCTRGGITERIGFNLENLLSPRPVDVTNTTFDVPQIPYPASPLVSTCQGKSAKLELLDGKSFLVIRHSRDEPFTDRPTARLCLPDVPLQVSWNQSTEALAVLFSSRVMVWVEGGNISDDRDQTYLETRIDLDLTFLGSQLGCKRFQWREDGLDIVFDDHLLRLRGDGLDTQKDQERDSALWHPQTLEYLLHFASIHTIERYCQYLFSLLNRHKGVGLWHLFDGDSQRLDHSSLERTVQCVQTKLAESKTGDVDSNLVRLTSLITLIPTLAGIPPNLDLAGRQCLIYATLETTNAKAYTSRIVIAGYHSKNQILIIDHLTVAHQGRLDWQMATRLGMVRWIRSAKLMSAQIESIARNELNKDDSRDPVLPSLFYLILGKKKVVQNLWRQAPWHPDSGNVSNFLKNDFEQSRWKLASKKNAYALLSRQRFRLAAFFFLLADSPQDAINVCLRQLEDVDLAIVIARYYRQDDASHDNESSYHLILRNALEKAILDHDRTGASWALAELALPNDALDVLCRPLSSVASRHLPQVDLSARALEPGDESMIALHYQIARHSFNSRQANERDLALFCVRQLLTRGSPIAALAFARTFVFSTAQHDKHNGVGEKAQDTQTGPIRTLEEEEYERPKTELSLFGKSQRRQVDLKAVETFSMDNFNF